MDFIRGALILTGLLTVGFTIIGVLKDCRGTNENYRDPCVLEVGEEIEVVAFSNGSQKYIELTIQGCDQNVVLRIIGVPPQQKPGDVTKYKVVKVVSDYSYDVEVIKPEKDTSENNE